MITKYKIVIFNTDTGCEPFSEWLKSLDEITADRIVRRTYRLKQGNFGEHKALICGGDKGTQRRDIIKAKKFWRAYHEKN